MGEQQQGLSEITQLKIKLFDSDREISRLDEELRKKRALFKADMERLDLLEGRTPTLNAR